ncbi:MAG: TlpA family protein disulfide reductase [Nitrospirales bacterium]|nr:TlpA family protein disulfide reductase [Nitrospirales bacterium]
MNAVIGKQAPNLEISEWIQGAPTNFDQEKGHIVVVEVFQVNCPGCFLFALPEAIKISNTYKDAGVHVIGLATAFEDFDVNTVENVKMLAETGQVIGETKNALSRSGQLHEGTRLSYKIPFPLGMDKLTKVTGEIRQETIMQFIYPRIPEFDSQSEEDKHNIIQRVKQYMRLKEYSAKTFDLFALEGTPSTIVVDRKGVLRDVSFGTLAHLDAMIQKLLNED